MRLGQIRALDAMGFRLGKRIRVPFIECFEVQEQDLVLLYVGPFAPTWPTLLMALGQLDPRARPIEVGGRVLLLVADSPALRGKLTELIRNARLVRKSEVLLEGTGFISSSIQRRFEPRQLVLPAIALLIVVIGLVLIPKQSPPVSSEAENLAEPVCPIQLSEADRKAWLTELLGQKPLTESSSVIYQSDLASVSVSVSEAIGSQVALRAIITCSDEQEATFLYRTNLIGALVLSSLPSD